MLKNPLPVVRYSSVGAASTLLILVVGITAAGLRPQALLAQADEKQEGSPVDEKEAESKAFVVIAGVVDSRQRMSVGEAIGTEVRVSTSRGRLERRSVIHVWFDYPAGCFRFDRAEGHSGFAKMSRTPEHVLDSSASGIDVSVRHLDAVRATEVDPFDPRCIGLGNVTELKRWSLGDGSAYFTERLALRGMVKEEGLTKLTLAIAAKGGGGDFFQRELWVDEGMQFVVKKARNYHVRNGETRLLDEWQAEWVMTDGTAYPSRVLYENLANKQTTEIKLNWVSVVAPERKVFQADGMGFSDATLVMDRRDGKNLRLRRIGDPGP